MQLAFMGLLCLAALLFWYVFAPLAVLLMLVISGIGNGDSDLLTPPIRARKRQR